MKQNDLTVYFEAFDHFFPEGGRQNDSSFLKWENRQKFVEEIKLLTEIDITSGDLGLIKAAQQKLSELTAEEKVVSETTPDKLKREQQEAERAAREAAEGAAKEKGIDQTQKFLKQQRERAQKLQEELDKQNPQIKVELKETPVKLSEEQAAAIDELKKESIQNPRAVVEQLTQEIKARITGNTPSEVLDVVAKQAAYDAVQTLRKDPESPVIQAVYLKAVVNSPAIIEKVIKNPTIAKEVMETATDLAEFRTLRLELSKQVFGSAFGEEAANAVFAQPEYTQTFSLSQIPQHQAQNLQDQNLLLEDIKNLGVDKAKAQIGSRLGLLIERRIAALPGGHFLKSEFVSNTLSVFGVGTPVGWLAAESASPIIKLAVSSGYGPILGTVQSITGWNLGISKATAGLATKAVAGTAAKTAISAGTKTGLAATLSTAFAALGSWAPIVGNVIGAAIGWAVGKIIEKIPWDKVKKVLPYVVGALLFPFFGPVVAVAGGLGTALIGGATLAGIGTGVGAFFWTLGRSTLITIGTPILVTLLVFPVVVALILFIINSGAYIVPPRAVSDVPFGPGFAIECTKGKIPVSFSNSTSSPIAKRAWEITSDLYQGFWCFWNRPPGDFPTDVVNYPPSYPNIFDERFFARNPNPTREQMSICGECLFWCTYLVQKAYRETGASLGNTLWSPTMQEDFTRRGKFIPAQEATLSNTNAGAVIFFDVVNALGRTDHVAIAHSVDIDGVKFIQSNAGTKDGFIPFGVSGGLQHLPGIEVVGIGNP